MGDIDETALPGIGTRHNIELRSGERIGVVTHRPGGKELLVYDRRDPDSCVTTIRLTDGEAEQLISLLQPGRPAPGD